jgi:hypothetical protein
VIPTISGAYQVIWGPSWSWSYGNWIYNYLCNQYLSPLMLWVRILPRRGVLDTTLCDQVCQWLVRGRWFSPCTPVSSTNKTDHHDITEILLKVALNTIIAILRYFPLILLSENFPSHDSRVRWKIIANR